ncbi:AfsR/SARP family transcriptional regulator [Actinoplanes rectilineatus]|uniref:AfsR/SARP family transcriptional regulator n=1 Tax=Actinoplanes rectilineatus TaxID=113571 RepID=UPI000AE12316|nr:BTAD domain-containing putative transcriptional regulator [Actinoplanes rectilineatus]
MSVNGDRGERLRVALFGVLRTGRGDAEITLPGARLRVLLARLAVSAGNPVSAGALTAALWPSEQPADPANALQSLVSRLRRLLGPGDVTQVEGGYRLAVTADDVDTARFERLAAAGRDCLRAGEPAAAAQLLGEAVEISQGPGAARGGGSGAVELRGGGPVAAELAEAAPALAARLAQAVAGTVADLAEAELALGLAGEAADRLTTLLAEDPLAERPAGLLMDALTAGGRQADALAVFERIRAELAEQLGADPGAALRDRHLRLLRAPAVPDEDLDGGDSPPTNLPAPLTGFIGREEDLARVNTLLGQGRLVTVLGPGGAGKTRLALEAARGRLDRCRDGTWLVDLTSVTEPAKVATALLTAAGLRGSALFDPVERARHEGRDELDVLTEQLAGRETLLVVDNCEHLIDAVAHLMTTLLARCPRLRVLATSREPLAIDGESLVPLGPLGLPEPDDTPEQAAQSPAVRLFVQRAAAVRPGFTVDGDSAGDVIRVVRGLDGLPLALELAAARLRTLALPDLADGLSDRFRMLTTGSRTAQPRHRTLGAVIDWSWQLLSGPERILAERVAVLPGGVNLASAVAVAAGTPVPVRDVPDLLAALVDRSLLRLAPDSGRYRMLETIREYGLARLTEQGVLGAVREAAARHLAAVVAAQDPILRTAGQLSAIRVFTSEYDNVLAALRHFCDAGDASAALGLALDLSWFWQMFGREADAGYWLTAAVSVAGDADLARVSAARALMVLNRHLEPGALTENAQQRRERLTELAQTILTLPPLPGPIGAVSAFTLYLAGQEEAAAAHIERLVQGPDLWMAALARTFRAQVAENQGDMAQLAEDVTAALAGFRQVGDRWGQATVLPMRSVLRQYEGDLDGAVADLRATRALAREFGALDLGDETFIDLRWAELHMRRGEPAEAGAAITAARARAERSGSPEMSLLVDALEAGMQVWLGDLDRADELLARAGRAAPGMVVMSGDHGTAIVASIRATIALRRGDPATAERELATAYQAGLETGDMPILAMVAVTAAALAVAVGRPREAAGLLGAAARLRGADDPTDMQVSAVSADARAVLGEEAFRAAYDVGRALDTSSAQDQVDPARLARAALPGPSLP